MHTYKFYCKKCGHYKEFPIKEDWAIEKKEHKRRGCYLEFAPHKNGYIFARPQIAAEVRKGKELAVAHELSLKIKKR